MRSERAMPALRFILFTSHVGWDAAIQISTLSLHESLFFCCFQKKQHTGAPGYDSAARESFCGLAFERMDRPVTRIVLLKRCDCPSFASHCATSNRASAALVNQDYYRGANLNAARPARYSTRQGTQALGCAKLDLKKPPPLVPRSLMISIEATGP